jgi:Holliday junction resolvase
MSEHREPAGAGMYQTIPHLMGYIASGRVEQTISFSRTFGSPSQMFVKKMKKYLRLRQNNDLISDQGV